MLELQKKSNHVSELKHNKESKSRGLNQWQLSAQELCDVHLATLRESFNHRLWPKDVVEKFLAVEI